MAKCSLLTTSQHWNLKWWVWHENAGNGHAHTNRSMATNKTMKKAHALQPLTIPPSPSSALQSLEENPEPPTTHCATQSHSRAFQHFNTYFEFSYFYDRTWNVLEEFTGPGLHKAENPHLRVNKHLTLAVNGAVINCQLFFQTCMIVLTLNFLVRKGQRNLERTSLCISIEFQHKKL